MVPVIKSPPSFNLKNIGRHMPRDRYQHGWIEETGKKVKKWKGHYYVYILTVDGKEKRRHCSEMLGLKLELRKWEAERELAKIIEKETKGNGPAKPDDTVTLSMVLGESLPSSGSLLGDARSKRLSFACLRPTSCQSSEQSDSAI